MSMPIPEMYSNTEKSQSSAVVEGPESPTDSKRPTVSPYVQPCPSPDESRHTIDPPSFKTRFTDAWWSLELVSMFFAVVTFTVWLVLLSQSNTYEVLAEESVLKGPFTYLPSMAGLLMSILRITMLYPVSAAMGQLKWQYFRRPGSRPVTDFKAFDDASRGVFGSLKMLTSKNGGHSLSVGCFLIIGSLFLESMAQNAIRPDNQERWYNVTSMVPGEVPYDGKALLPYTIHYNSYMDRGMDGSLDNLTASPSMQAAFYTAWSYYENRQFIRPEINTLPINCSEDACRWNDVITLAANFTCHPAPTATDPDGFIYATQADINNHLNVAGLNESEAHFGALFLKSSPRIPLNSSFASLVDNPGIIMHIAGLAVGREDGKIHYEAVECILYWQVRHISEAMFNTTTDVLDHFGAQGTRLERVTMDDKGENITIPAPCVDTNGETECGYSITRLAHIGLQNFLVRNIAGSVYIKNDQVFIEPETVVMGLLMSTMFEGGHTPTLQAALDYYLTNVVISIGDDMRTVSGTNISGKVHVIEPYYDIYWRFALYPGLLLLLSMCFVFVTMWRTWKLPVWKTSTLPMLYHGFDRPVGGEQYDVTNLAWMTQVSKNTQCFTPTLRHILRNFCFQVDRDAEAENPGEGPLHIEAKPEAVRNVTTIFTPRLMKRIKVTFAWRYRGEQRNAHRQLRISIPRITIYRYYYHCAQSMGQSQHQAGRLVFRT
ncbi:hypothetical protein CSOJ01_07505 [Colletotrichum sojae]|uniref:Uncharacterized protein n=1 Tax=Colletotrichum sojae TaxID=2175907 RepID=A0A8H6J8T1_9PEZI|nr:hypothetical protein CSOJ01_07505 [Colletotrichum sojae]